MIKRTVVYAKIISNGNLSGTAWEIMQWIRVSAVHVGSTSDPKLLPGCW